MLDDDTREFQADALGVGDRFNGFNRITVSDGVLVPPPVGTRPPFFFSTKSDSEDYRLDDYDLVFWFNGNNPLDPRNLYGQGHPISLLSGALIQDIIANYCSEYPLVDTLRSLLGPRLVFVGSPLLQAGSEELSYIVGNESCHGIIRRNASRVAEVCDLLNLQCDSPRFLLPPGKALCDLGVQTKSIYMPKDAFHGSIYYGKLLIEKMPSFCL
jgi:hypothetical protein